MSISVACDHCGAAYTASSALAGKRVRCKACGGAFAIAAAPARPPKAPTAAECQDFNDIDWSGVQAEPSAPRPLPQGPAAVARSASDAPQSAFDRVLDKAAMFHGGP